MSEKRIRPLIEPRGYTLGEVAGYLGHTRNWLTPARLAELQKHGFPAVDPLLERVDRLALDRWWNARSGILPALDETRATEPASPKRNSWREAMAHGGQDSPRHRHP